MIQIPKFWKSEDEQLDMIMEYWKKENNAVEALAALRKDLKGLKQEGLLTHEIYGLLRILCRSVV